VTSTSKLDTLQKTLSVLDIVLTAPILTTVDSVTCTLSSLILRSLNLLRAKALVDATAKLITSQNASSYSAEHVSLPNTPYLLVLALFVDTAVNKVTRAAPLFA
jgi:hypothetical protein